jgi:AmpD protein
VECFLIYPLARQCPSPYFNHRPAGCEVELLVIHCISLPPGEFGGRYIEHFFCGTLDTSLHPYFETIADLKVSSHFLIDRNGQLVQFVDCSERAWHAGVSSWQGRENCNDFSIGIELEGTDTLAYTEAQYSALVTLTRWLQGHYPKITDDHIVGHCDIAPDRKTDPGPAFDWNYFYSLLSRESL